MCKHPLRSEAESWVEMVVLFRHELGTSYWRTSNLVSMLTQLILSRQVILIDISILEAILSWISQVFCYCFPSSANGRSQLLPCKIRQVKLVLICLRSKSMWIQQDCVSVCTVINVVYLGKLSIIEFSWLGITSAMLTCIFTLLHLQCTEGHWEWSLMLYVLSETWALCMKELVGMGQ